MEGKTFQLVKPAKIKSRAVTNNCLGQLLHELPIPNVVSNVLEREDEEGGQNVEEVVHGGDTECPSEWSPISVHHQAGHGVGDARPDVGPDNDRNDCSQIYLVILAFSHQTDHIRGSDL